PATALVRRGQRAPTGPLAEPLAAKAVLIGITVSFLAVFLLLPLVVVFYEALRSGIGAYFATFADAEARAAIRLTLIVAVIAVPANLVFGVAASWAIAKFEFRGKAVLTTLIDLPFSVSPVIAGFVYIILFGAQGFFGPMLKRSEEHTSE